MECSRLAATAPIRDDDALVGPWPARRLPSSTWERKPTSKGSPSSLSVTPRVVDTRGFRRFVRGAAGLSSGLHAWPLAITSEILTC